MISKLDEKPISANETVVPTNMFRKDPRNESKISLSLDITYYLLRFLMALNLA